ncbi:MAG: hypothetical protein C00003105_00474 [ANME-2 cluster archaeon HR1]|nr:MAG: hypothetical protein C00003105_00474 [ANME-2 cluster archaeon HR1]
MVIIKPFKTTILNPGIPDLNKLICPVYDVIDKTEYDNYGNNSNNIIHLTTRNNSVDSVEFIDKAKKNLTRLFTEGILKESKHPALYIYGIRYSLPDDMMRDVPGTGERNIYFAFGLVALVKIEHPGKGNIVGHENIFEKNSIERSELMKACRMNFAPIVSEYNMPGHDINIILEDYLGFKRPELVLRDDRPPLVDLTLHNTRHLLWEISDIEVIRNIQELMSDKKLLILDGHHRFSAARRLSKQDGIDYTMMMLMEGGDRALLLLPWHRCIRNYNHDMLNTQLDRFFNIIWKGDQNDEFNRILHTKDDKFDVRIGFYNKKTFSVIRAHRDKVIQLSDKLGEKTGLDYLSLNEWIIEPCIDGNKEDNIVFTDSVSDAALKVDGQGFNAAFLMRPLTIKDVEYKAHVEMKNFPQKSTLFLPKVAEGIIMRRIQEDDPK